MAIIRSAATVKAAPVTKPIAPKIEIASTIVAEDKASKEQALAESTTTRIGGATSTVIENLVDEGGKDSASDGGTQD
jgi:hypothetical protein